MTRYAEDIATPVAFPGADVADTLAETLCAAGIRQLHAAETEKYAHVTYFFNGGEEAAWEGETRVLVPVAARRRELRPEAGDVGRRRRRRGRRRRSPDGYGFCVVNFANPDMVGHTGRDPRRRRRRRDGRRRARPGRRGDARARRRLPRHRRSRQRREDARGGRRQPAHRAHDEPRAARRSPPTDVDLRDGGELADLAPTVLALLGLPVSAAR